MAKPSIFSRDYEKIMKKRKRRKRLAIISVFLISIIGFTVYKYDMQEIKATVKNLVLNKGIKEDVYIEEEGLGTSYIDKHLEVKLNDYILTLKVIENNNQLQIEEVLCDKELISVDINKNRDKAIIIDKNQNMYLINNNKQVVNLTRNEYVSTNGEIYLKDEIINSNKNYIWNNQARFISDDKIAYVTNIPYFEGDLKQCVSIVKIDDNIHKVQQILEGNIVSFNGIDEKGLKVEIDGNIMYITPDGQIMK